MKIKKLTIVGPTRESDFDSCYSTGDCRMAFSRFIKSQSILEDLTLMNFKPPATLFGDNSLDTVQFRLKKLKVNNFRLDNLNFFHFLDNHRDSIEVVDMDSRGLSHEFVSFLESSPNFTELIFAGILTTARPFKTVTKLTAMFALTRPYWTTFFPNVKELKVQSERPLGFSFGYFESLKKLEKLEIHDSFFPNNSVINIPTVKYLTLRKVTSDVPKFFNYETANLVELKVDGCNAAFLPFYLRHKNTKLKKLIVTNLNLNELRKCIVINYKEKNKKVEHLEFINVTNEEDGDLDDYHIIWGEKLT
jgi:hypothetical protein